MFPPSTRSLRSIVAAAALMLPLASCAPDPIEVEVQPEEAQDCGDLIPTGEALAVQLLAAIETVPIDVLTGDTPPDGILADLLDKGRLYDERTLSLGCDPAELNAAIMEKVGDDLEPGSLAGAILLEIMQGGALGDGLSVPASPTGSDDEGSGDG